MRPHCQFPKQPETEDDGSFASLDDSPCHYRSLVDRLNGELMHHDGGMEDSRQRLDALLASADVVICPASYVSHDAYLRAKRYCKRTRKPCVLMKSAGVVSFAQALEQVA